MTKLIKVIVAVAIAAIGQTLFAYNGGYENSSLTDMTIGGVTYKGFGNNTLTARNETGTTIAENRYAQCKKLTSVNLANVTSIGNAAFAYSALTSVELPATLASIGYIPFGGCANLSSVTINGTAFMKSGDEAKEPFRDCTALKTVTAKCAPPSWDFKKVFPNVTTVKTAPEHQSAWSGMKYSDVTVRGLGVKITFNGNGGVVSGKESITNEGLPGNLFGKLATGVKDGQVFVGWYTAATGGAKINSSTPVPEEDTTYYAHYTPRYGYAKSFLNSNITAEWESNGWAGQSVVSCDGFAARCGYIVNNGHSYLLTHVTGPGTLTFKWKVSCEAGGNDALRMLVDGVEKKTLSGERDWASVTIMVYGSGTHELKWNYTKNATVSKGDDFAWLDEVKWAPATQASYRAPSHAALEVQAAGKSQGPVITSVLAGSCYSGLLADGTGIFSMIVADDGLSAWLRIESADGDVCEEVSVLPAEEELYLTSIFGDAFVIRNGLLEMLIGF